MAVVTGHVKIEETSPLQQLRLKELERSRAELAETLRSLLDLKFGRWSPHYLPTLRSLLAVEMQIDGFKYALDLATATE